MGIVLLILSKVWGFAKKHWKLTAVTVLATVVLGYIGVLHLEINHYKNYNKSLYTQNTNLSKAIRHQNKAIDAAHKKELEIQKQVAEAVKANRNTEKQTQQQIKRIYKAKIAKGCKPAMDWLRTELIKEAHGGSHGG